MLGCGRLDCERQLGHAFDAAGHERADRNAPARRLTRRPMASRKTEKSSEDDTRDLAEADCAPPSS